MTLQEMEKMDKKSKFKKVFTRIAVGVSVAFNLLFVGILAVGCANVKKSNNAQQKGVYHQNDTAYVYRKDKMNVEYQPRYATYNDEEYKITLTSTELSEGVWQNLYNYLYNNQATLTCTSSYNSTDYVSNNYDVLYLTPHVDYISFSYSSLSKSLYINTEYQFVFDTGGAPLTLSNVLYFTSDSTYYSYIKNAIELDINGDVPSSDDDFTQDIFGAITDSLGGFVNTLNSGITSMVSVFYDSVNHNLTTMGLLSVIVVSVALAYWLFRLIIGLIRMRG